MKKTFACAVQSSFYAPRIVNNQSRTQLWVEWEPHFLSDTVGTKVGLAGGSRRAPAGDVRGLGAGRPEAGLLRRQRVHLRVEHRHRGAGPRGGWFGKAC